jgi:tol-pal system protein YbgF
MTYRPLIPSVLVILFVLAAGAITAPLRAQTAGKAAGDDDPANQEAALSKRIKRLEERLVDMNAIIGTLESLVGNKSGSAMVAPGTLPPGSPEDVLRPRSDAGRADGSSDLADRIDGMETQIQALASQLEQLTLQLNDVEARLGSTAPPPGAVPREEDLTPPLRDKRTSAPNPRSPIVGEMKPGEELRGNGPVAAAPHSPDDSGRRRPAPGADNPPADERTSAPIAPQWPGNRLASRNDPLAKSLYDEAYEHLLRRDYRAAEIGFREFLKRYPNDDLSGNAQYWLGESYYVRGQYRAAADNFLKGYSKYKSNPKASDSLLKLAMSLKELGESTAACQTFRALNEKYPAAPVSVKKRAALERRRLGC